MTNRVLIAIGAALGFVGATLAQAPPGTPTLPPAASGVPALPPPAAADGPAVPFHSFCAGEGCADPGPRFWVTADYLLSWIQSNRLPPLVTTSPAGTPQAAAGVLGMSTTTTLFGDSRVNGDARSGIRLGAGFLIDPSWPLGVEAGAMMLESQATGFSAASDGTRILARPFTDATTGLPTSVLIAFPGSSSGSVNVLVRSGNFYEAHLDLTETAIDKGWFRLQSILGYRFYRYDEGLHIGQTINPIGAAFVPGTQLSAVDDFVAKNEFHGCDLGFRAQFPWQSVTMDLLGKVAVGNLHRVVSINGSTVTTVPGNAPVTQQGGVLALSSNIGTFSKNDFTIFPELGINLSWQVRPNLRLRGGYSALILTDAVRAAGQVDTTLNPNLFPSAVPGQAGANRPAFILNRQDVIIHNLSAGLEFRF
jgi:hypothetical protein